MELLRLLYITLIQMDDELWKADEEYQKMWNQKNELEKELVLGMTKKQRVLFSEYREQREKLITHDLRRILSHYTILVQPKN